MIITILMYTAAWRPSSYLFAGLKNRYWLYRKAFCLYYVWRQSVFLIDIIPTKSEYVDLIMEDVLRAEPLHMPDYFQHIRDDPAMA